MSELVEKLAQGDHKVEVSIRPDRTPAALKHCLDQGYFHLKFTGTRGGTDLYVPLEPENTDMSRSDFQNGVGSLRLSGRLTLDYIPVRCIADIDLATMAGHGHLEKLS